MPWYYYPPLVVIHLGKVAYSVGRYFRNFDSDLFDNQGSIIKLATGDGYTSIFDGKNEQLYFDSNALGPKTIDETQSMHIPKDIPLNIHLERDRNIPNLVIQQCGGWRRLVEMMSFGFNGNESCRRAMIESRSVEMALFALESLKLFPDIGYALPLTAGMAMTIS